MLFLYVGVPGAEPLLTCNRKVIYAALSFNSSDKQELCRQQRDNREKLGVLLGVHLALLETHFFVLISLPSQMKAVLSNLDLLVEDAKWWNFQIPSSN
jgi:hypothetical protein